jgi:transposase-like protein
MILFQPVIQLATAAADDLPAERPAERLRTKRRGKAGRSWYVDETPIKIKVHGRWCYLYRPMDRNGNLVDSLLSETRDLKAAQRFFRGARAVVGHAPDRVTTDGHEAYPRRSAGRWAARWWITATAT